jgi:hypothetical protein
MRAVRLTLKLDADDMRELSYALRTIADHAERGELTIGVSGGPCSGYIYELLQDPTMTHDAYHAELRAYLDALKQPPPVVCGNCDTALPEVCGGLFKDAAKDYAELDKIAGDLAVLVVRLARALRKASPDNDLPEKAMDYLNKHDFGCEPLRKGSNAKLTGRGPKDLNK